MRRAAGRFLRVVLTMTWVGAFLVATSGPAAAATNPWSSAGSMAQARSSHTATLLPNGEVLVVGGYDGSGPLASAELYDPATNTWSPAASMAQARSYHTATLLGDGEVLVAGGSGASGVLASAELYDPGTNTWSPAASMVTARALHTATLLPDGEVLVVGGFTNSSRAFVASAERYDPATDTWLRGGRMPSGKYDHTATLLPNGKVLVAGGTTWGAGDTAEADVFTPPKRWFVAAPMAYNRSRHTATLLADGDVLVAGGSSFPSSFGPPELYHPDTNSWSPGGTMVQPRTEHTATLLESGRVLVAGGYAGTGLTTSAEQYDPITNVWSSAGNMAHERSFATATRLPNGRVLVVGGAFGASPETELASAELYNPFTPVEDNDPAVQFDGWAGFTDPSANGGAYRASKTAKNTAKFTFSGTAVTWLSRSGPDRGIASVTIDGVTTGTFDLYSATPSAYSQTFSGLASGSHAIVVKVLGTKNASSTDTWVPVDGFTVGAVTTQESSLSVKYGTWVGQSNPSASGGTYRINGTAGGQVTFPFSGTGIDWVTATGPGYGQAQVTIDGVSKGTVDLYQPSVQWQVLESYSGLSSGSHTIVVKVLGKKNASSTGTGVVVDAFIVHV